MKTDPGVSAIDYGTELIRLGSIFYGAEVPRVHAELDDLVADVASTRRCR